MANTFGEKLKQSTWNYMRLFFLIGIAFGLAMAVLISAVVFISTRSIDRALFLGSAVGLVSGVIFGGIMAGIIGAWRRQAHEALDQPVNSEISRERQSMDVEINAPYDVAFERAVHAVGTNNITGEDREAGTIEATLPPGRISGSEIVSLRVRGRKDGRSVVSVSSEPPVEVTIVANGKRLSNVDRIVKRLRGQGA